MTIMPVVKTKLYPQPGCFTGAMSAKSYKKALGMSVELHNLTAGKVCERLLKPDITSKYTLNWIKLYLPLELIPFIVACHDLGKLSPAFQAMLRYFLGEKAYEDYADIHKYGTSKHEVITYIHMKPIIGSDVSKLLLYHHGTYRNGKYNPEQSSGVTENDGWYKLRSELVEKLAKEFDIDLKNLKPICIENISFLKYLAGLVCVSDWIASDENLFLPSGYNPGDITHLIEKGLSTYNFFKTDFSLIPKMSFKEVFSKDPLKQFDPNPIQTEMMNAIKGPGLYILEATMGLGKTEAALYPALELCRTNITDGIYFAMPTQVTSNRIFDRMQKALENWFNKNDLHLIHGCSDIFHNPKEEDWFKGNKKAILDEFGVGTVDQILLGVLPQAKFFFLRTFGMYRKTVIFDEIHSYDIYTSELIKTLIKELIEMDCVVIILTATLTNKFKEELLNAV